MKTIAVFCGSKAGGSPKYLAAARLMGTLCAHAGWGLVYGGGRVGLMGAVADAALAAGGQVIGVIPKKLMDREVAHPGLTTLEVVPDMAQRKDRMIAQSDAFVSLPGGLGTLDEMFEVLTLAQLNYHAKPSAILNLDGFYDGLIANCATMSKEGFLYPGVWESVICEDSPARLMERLQRVLESGTFKS